MTCERKITTIYYFCQEIFLSFWDISFLIHIDQKQKKSPASTKRRGMGIMVFGFYSATTTERCLIPFWV